jgi:hypothetical protein
MIKSPIFPSASSHSLGEPLEIGSGFRKGRQKVDWYNGKPSRALRGKSKVKWSSADVHETRARPTLATNSRIFRDNLSA